MPIPVQRWSQNPMENTTKKAVILYWGGASETVTILKNLTNFITSKEEIPPGTTHIIRYGNRGQNELDNRPGIKILNKCANIKLSSDKLVSLKKLKDSGILVPSFTTDINTAKIWLDSSPIVVRKFHHFGGKGFWLILQKNDLRLQNVPSSDVYYMKYIKTSREFRVHVFRGEVTKVDEKLPVEMTEPTLEKLVIRNFDHGWRFKPCREFPQSLKIITANAAKAIGLDFTAIDVLCDDYDNLFVIECNSAPGLDGYNAELFATKLKQWVEQCAE